MRALLLSALALVAGHATAFAEVQPIAHGRHLGARHVGPAAIGITPARTAGFTALADGKPLPEIAREIAADATYDGVAVAGPHILIEGVTFSGRLDITTARTVVVRGCRFRFADWYGIMVRATSQRAVLTFNDIGAASTDGAPDDARHRMKVGIAVSGRAAFVWRNHISMSEDGIQIGGAEDTVLRENLIERLTYYKDAHPDGIQIVKSATRTLIERNRVLNPLPTTSAIIFDSRTGRVDGVTIRDNYLAGGGWTLYGGAHRDGSLSHRVAITGNVFGRDFFPKSGHFGPLTYWDARQGTLSGNTFADGAPIR